MPKERDLAIFTAIYDNVDDAEADLDAIEDLHKDDFIGVFDAAVIDQKNGKPHIVKRLDRPAVRVIPEDLGFGASLRKELKAAAAELSAGQVGLIMIGQPTLEKGFDKAVTRASKVVKETVGRDHRRDRQRDEGSGTRLEAGPPCTKVRPQPARHRPRYHTGSGTDDRRRLRAQFWVYCPLVFSGWWHAPARYPCVHGATGPGDQARTCPALPTKGPP